MGSLDGYATLVTGGGSGIGFGCAQALLADGADVTICGRTESRLSEAVGRLEKLAAESGGRVAAIVADVTDEDDVAAAVAKAAEPADGKLHALVNSAGGSRHMGPLHMADVAVVRETLAAESGGRVAAIVADVTDEDDVAAAVAKAAEPADGKLHALVNSAGGSRHMGPLHMADVAVVRETLDLNAVGTFLTIKHSAPRMAAAGGGSYVSISSHAGRDTFRFLGIYGAAKAAMDFLVRVAADELGPSRIRFNSVLPGGIATEIMEGVTAGGPVLDSYHRQTPLWRFGTVEDVSALVRFLVGPESQWISGQLFSVDGGQSVRGSADFSAFARMAYGEDPLWQMLEEQSHAEGDV